MKFVMCLQCRTFATENKMPNVPDAMAKPPKKTQIFNQNSRVQTWDCETLLNGVAIGARKYAFTKSINEELVNLDDAYDQTLELNNAMQMYDVRAAAVNETAKQHFCKNKTKLENNPETTDRTTEQKRSLQKRLQIRADAIGNILKYFEQFMIDKELVDDKICNKNVGKLTSTICYFQTKMKIFARKLDQNRRKMKNVKKNANEIEMNSCLRRKKLKNAWRTMRRRTGTKPGTRQRWGNCPSLQIHQYQNSKANPLLMPMMVAGKQERTLCFKMKQTLMTPNSGSMRLLETFPEKKMTMARPMESLLERYW